MVVPYERFRLADPEAVEVPKFEPAGPVTTRVVGRKGKIFFAGESYTVGVWLEGETVEVGVEDGLVRVSHREVLVVSHVQRRRHDRQTTAFARPAKRRRPRPRQATTGQAVTRKVDSSGSVCLAATTYRACRAHRGRQVHLAIVGDVIEISSGGEVIRTHPIRRDRSREHGTFANPGGRPHRINAA
jgi:hypothetical protein